MALIRVSVYDTDRTPFDVRLINTNCIIEVRNTKAGDYFFNKGCRSRVYVPLSDENVVTLYVAETLDQLQRLERTQIGDDRKLHRYKPAKDN
jgi:hypothetical protein